MTLNEFKAFLEGYEASFVDGVPSAKQYVVIKEKLANVAVAIEYKPKPLPINEPNRYPPFDRVWFGPNTSKDSPFVAPATWTR